MTPLQKGSLTLLKVDEAGQTRLTETFAPYIKDDAGHYSYRVKGKQADEPSHKRPAR